MGWNGSRASRWLENASNIDWGATEMEQIQNGRDGHRGLAVLRTCNSKPYYAVGRPYLRTRDGDGIAVYRSV